MDGDILASCGVGLAAFYVLTESGHELRLAEVVEGVDEGGWAATAYALAGPSPVADACRLGRPLWLTTEESARYGRPGHTPVGSPDDAAPHTPVGSPHDAAPADALSVGALPLGGEARLLGCLLVMGRAGGGFSADQRTLLELHAGQAAAGLAAASARVTCRTRSVPGPRPALLSARGGCFVLDPGTGHIDVDPAVLDLFGVPPQDFDGDVSALLECTAPDDVPALMSVVEPQQNDSDQNLAFRIRHRNGELRWLGLRCRVLAGPEGRPRQVLGVVSDASYLRPGADDVSLVQRLSAALSGATTVRDVNRVVVDFLRAHLDAGRVTVAELEGDHLVVTVLDPPEPDAWPRSWRAQRPEATCHDLRTLRNALREGHVSLWPAATELEPDLRCVGPGGLAVLPLPADGRMVGVCLVGWDGEHRFGPGDRSLLTATAGVMGQALARAHALDAGHEFATMLQRSLLPRKLPQLDGGVAVARYLPATVGLEVGGDWYDVVTLSDSRLALVIGDVQGHSAAAATIMGQMRTAIRAYAVEGHPPDVVVAHANQLLVGMETDLFATCTYVDLDMEEGTAWVVRAGHLPPLLRLPDATTEEPQIEGGPPLGVIADGDFPMTQLSLAPGTLVTLLTDGLVESATLPLEDGMRAVREVLAAADPADPERVADQLVASARHRRDDVAALILRYDGMRVRPVRAHWAVWRLPDAVMHARRFTARTLRTWSVVEESDVALLVVSELVTNAIAHTTGEVRLDLTLTGDRLRIAVNDASPRTPVKAESVDWEETGGRGLLLVAAMSSAWGSVPLGGGKQVWCDIALSPRDEPPPGVPPPPDPAPYRPGGAG
ncbi:SpoIIE family protein phosphatase [Streptomyces sp. NPDC053367]|uniref:SpoIIE family protein phosphatase n=1 Tax=Streptomyces sp. NPDC053367 TaxID=3365700 RepID=UPI0037D061C8